MWVFRNRLVSIVVLLFIVQQTNGIGPYVLFSEIMTTWGNLEKIFKPEEDPNKEIVDGIRKIQGELQAMGSGAIHDIELKVDDLPETQQRIDAFGRFNQYNLQIRNRAKSLKDFSKYDDFDAETLKDFADNSIGSGQDDINMLLKMLSDYLIGNDEITIKIPSLLTMFVQWMKKSPDLVCKSRISPQHFLYSIFDDFLTTNLKGFTIAQFSYMIRQTQTNRSQCRERETLYTNIIETLNKTKDLIIDAIREVNQTVWRCEPEQHIRGITYDEATHFEQMMLIFKGVLNQCDGLCEDVPRGFTPKKCSTNWEFCTSKKFETCNGRISQCISTAHYSYTCPSTDPNRRYDAIRNFINAGLFGGNIDNHYGKNTSNECLNGEYDYYHPDPCFFCMCNCVSDDSDRYFNLHEVVSNVTDDMVVTGIRIKKHNKIFHLQIQEGKLIGQMKINSTTLRWTPLEDYKITDPGIKSNIDYHELEYLGSLIELPTHKMNSSYVVTGVKFSEPQDAQESGLMPLTLSVRFTEFDMNNEKLFKSKSHWVTTTDSRPLKTVTLNEPDIPTGTYRSKINWDDKKIAKFQASDLKKDAGQSTIPFLDVQDVISYPPSPLSGVGLYHKGANGFGGFIGPKILTYDFADYLSSQEIPKDEFPCENQKKINQENINQKEWY